MLALIRADAARAATEGYMSTSRADAASTPARGLGNVGTSSSARSM